MAEFKEDIVILKRFDATEGYFSFADVLKVVGELQNRGVEAFAERAPGALMDTPDAYYIKVPVSQREYAMETLVEIVKKS